MISNFAEKFRTLRKQSNFTQEKIAEKLGVSGQAVSRWELGICYPDLELLAPIANCFGVTIDFLLSNDNESKEKAHLCFLDEINCSPYDEKRIEFVLEYCHNYPDVSFYAYQLVDSIVCYVVGDQEKTKQYMSLLLQNAEKLLDTSYRSGTIQLMSAVCDDSEVEKWLDMAPYSGFSRRYCLNNRAMLRKDFVGSHVQNGLELFEHLADLLDRRCPDSFGSEYKAQFQRDIMKVIRSFGECEVPDGWKLFYAYKQLVLSACLFDKGEKDEGWQNFNSAISLCKHVFSLKENWLEIGGALFSDIRVDKSWCNAIDRNGAKHKLFNMHRLSFYNMEFIYSLLTNPKWAWFDSVRNTEKYQAAVSWVKTIVDEQNEE